MKKKSRTISAESARLHGTGNDDPIIPRLDAISKRMDILINILVDVLLANPRYGEGIPYTDKAAHLETLGLEVQEISRIVGRPSNWVSSRLREHKARKSSRRSKALSSEPKRKL